MENASRPLNTQNWSESYFVTGIHRSGTSWVAKMISFADDFVVKDEEIFNLGHPIQKSPIKQWYTHICEENEQDYFDFVNRVLANKYGLIDSFAKARSFRQFAQVCWHKGRSTRRQFTSPNNRLILVEPNGLLSAEWFHRRCGFTIVVLIRHPASFVGSLKRLGWRFDFRNLAEQDVLMRKYFSDYRHEIENPPASHDIIGQGILLWKLMYTVVLNYQKQFGDWVYVRHEDLARDPISGYRALYERLGLKFAREHEEAIHHFSTDTNPGEVSVSQIGEIRRNSKATITTWKRRLSADEILRVKEGVWPVAQYWYGDGDW